VSVSGHGAGAVGWVITGGQSGVDRAATDVAIEVGVPYRGWVPRGGQAEDVPDAPGVLTAYPGFTPTDEDDPAVRTKRNVLDADGVLILRPPTATSPGTDLTRALADRHGVAVVVIDPGDPDGSAALEAFTSRLPQRCALNIAGPKETEWPGAYASTRAFLQVHRHLLFG
jgi:Circularly permutated YpsA SLOG family